MLGRNGRSDGRHGAGRKIQGLCGAHPRRNAANAGRRAGSRPDVARSPQLRAAEPAGLPGTGLVLALSRRARPAADGRRPDADHASHAQTPTEPTLRRYPGARHGIRYRVADPLGAGARPNGQCRTAAGQHRPLHVRQKHELRRQHARDRLAKMDVDHPRRGEHHARRPLVPHLRPEQRSQSGTGHERAGNLCRRGRLARRPGTAAAAYPRPAERTGSNRSPRDDPQRRPTGERHDRLRLPARPTFHAAVRQTGAGAGHPLRPLYRAG